MLELFYVRHTSLALDSRIFVIAFKAMGGGGGRDHFKSRRRHRRRRPQAPLHARGCGLPVRPRRRGVQPGACSGFQSDDEGESISAFNASYSGLTGLYWLWRNVGADVKGFVYYRRLLGSPDPASRRAEDPFDRVATGGGAEVSGRGERRHPRQPPQLLHRDRLRPLLAHLRRRALRRVPRCALRHVLGVRFREGSPHASPSGAYLQHVRHEGGPVRCLLCLAVPRLGGACRLRWLVRHDVLRGEVARSAAS